jgi:hypothetical protein
LFVIVLTALALEVSFLHNPVEAKSVNEFKKETKKTV